MGKYFKLTELIATELPDGYVSIGETIRGTYNKNPLAPIREVWEKTVEANKENEFIVHDKEHARKLTLYVFREEMWQAISKTMAILEGK